jgi:hypothetical protein
MRKSYSQVEEQENIRLRYRLEELRSKVRAFGDHNQKLIRKSFNRSQIVQSKPMVGDKVTQLKSSIKTLVQENTALCN